MSVDVTPMMVSAYANMYLTLVSIRMKRLTALEPWTVKMKIEDGFVVAGILPLLRGPPAARAQGAAFALIQSMFSDAGTDGLPLDLLEALGEALQSCLRESSTRYLDLSDFTRGLVLLQQCASSHAEFYKLQSQLIVLSQKALIVNIFSDVCLSVFSKSICQFVASSLKFDMQAHIELLCSAMCERESRVLSPSVCSDVLSVFVQIEEEPKVGWRPLVVIALAALKNYNWDTPQVMDLALRVIAYHWSSGECEKTTPAPVPLVVNHCECTLSAKTVLCALFTWKNGAVPKTVARWGILALRTLFFNSMKNTEHPATYVTNHLLRDFVRKVAPVVAKTADEDMHIGLVHLFMVCQRRNPHVLPEDVDSVPHLLTIAESRGRAISAAKVVSIENDPETAFSVSASCLILPNLLTVIAVLMREYPDHKDAHPMNAARCLALALEFLKNDKTEALTVVIVSAHRIWKLNDEASLAAWESVRSQVLKACASDQWCVCPTFTAVMCELFARFERKPVDVQTALANAVKRHVSIALVYQSVCAALNTLMDRFGFELRRYAYVMLEACLKAMGAFPEVVSAALATAASQSIVLDPDVITDVIGKLTLSEKFAVVPLHDCTNEVVRYISFLAIPGWKSQGAYDPEKLVKIADELSNVMEEWNAALGGTLTGNHVYRSVKYLLLTMAASTK